MKNYSRVVLSTPFSRTAIFAVVGLLAPFGVLSLALLQPGNSVDAAINEQLHFQARLLTSGGSLVPDGNYNVQFHIYSDGDGVPGTTDETLEWSGSYLKGNTQGIDVVNGYVTANLGESASAQVNTLADVDWNNSTLWLSINIGDTTSTSTSCTTEAGFDTNCGGDGEMGPFIRLGSSPYAFNSKQLGGREASQFVQLDPGGTSQAVNTANAVIDVDQAGAGALINLEVASSQVFGVDASGNVTQAGDLTVTGGDATLGVGSTTNGQVVLQNATNNFTVTLNAPSQTTGNTTISFPDTGADTADTICLQDLNNCAGSGDILQNGNTFGANIVIGSNDAFALQFETGGVVNATIADGGAVTFQNETDSTAAFRVLNAAGTNTAFVVDTTNTRVGIGDATPDGSLDVLFTSTSTTASTYEVAEFVLSDTGDVQTGTENSIGQDIQVIRNGVTATSTATFNNTGTKITVIGDTDGTSTNIGLDVNVSGADTNYAALFNGGSVGIGTTTPGYALEVASTAQYAAYFAASSTDTANNYTGGIFLQNTSATNNNYSAIGFNNANAQAGATIATQFVNHLTGTNAIADLVFSTRNTGDGQPIERLRIEANGDLTTPSTTLNVFNATPTTVNFAGAATTLELGAATGTTSVNNNLSVDGTTTIGTLGTTDNASFVCRNTSNILAGCNFTPLSSDLTDNIADALDIQEGTNNYININTTDASENISFGNATTNPSFNFLGSGTLTVAGPLQQNGNLTVGSGAGSTAVLTVNGSTKNATLAVSDDADGGPLGGGLAASASVDIYTSISINQTTDAQTITLPTPTDSTGYGRVLYISNIGTATFTMLDQVVAPGTSLVAVWSNTNGGATWQTSGTAKSGGAAATVSTSASGGASGAVASANPASADYINTSTTSAEDTINTALTAVGNAGGGTVILMEGTYIVDGSISIPNNVTLSGTGLGSIIKVVNGHDATLSAIVNSDTTTGTKVGLTNLQLDGNKANQTFTSGESMRGVFWSGVGSATRDGGSINNVVIKNFGSESVNAAGIYLASSYKNVISDNVISGIDDDGIITFAAFGNIINNNSVYDNGQSGIVAYLSSVTGNTTRGNGLAGIYSSGSAVSGNYSEADEVGIYVESSGANAAITGNQIYNYTTYGIQVNGNRQIVSGNNLQTGGGATTFNGIYVSGDDNSIVGNYIYDTSCSTNCYAINIAGTADSTYLADNVYSAPGADQATINDAGTNTIYANQLTPAQILQSGSSLIKATSSSTLTGTADPDGTTTLPGTGTKFTTELQVGDRITVNAETRTVTAIASDTSLTVDTAFTDTAAAAVTRLPAALRVTDSSNNTDFIISDQGYIGIGVVAPTVALDVSGSGAFTGTIQVDTLGTTDTATFICRNTSNILAGCNYTPLNPTLTDNITDALDIQEGTNNYININTTDASENISFGNATTNPSFNLLGSGNLTVNSNTTLFQNTANSNNSFSIQNAAGDTAFLYDSTEGEFSFGVGGYALTDNEAGDIQFQISSSNTTNGTSLLVNTDAVAGDAKIILAECGGACGSIDGFSWTYDGGDNALYLYSGTGGSINNRLLTINRNTADLELGNNSLDGSIILNEAANNNTVTINTGTQSTGSFAVSFPTLAANDTFCLQSNNCGYVASSLTDNIADALDIQEGTNNYININTTDASENISFGNATTNPSFNFLGSGALNVAGATTITGLTTLNGGLTVEAGDTFTFNGDAFTDLTGSGLTVSGNALTVDNTVLDDNFFIQNGNSFGATAVLGTNDAFGLTLEVGGVSALQIADGGAITVQNETDSTNAFRIQNATGVNLLNIDNSTTNNLVTNGGIEIDTTGWAVKGSSAIARNTANKYEGDASLAITTTAAIDDGAEYAYTFTASTEYTLTLFVKGSADFSTLDIGRQDNGADIDCLSDQNVTSSGWTRYSCTFTTGGTISGSNIYVKQSDATARTIYIDAIHLEQTGSESPYQNGLISLNGVISSPTFFQNQEDSTNALSVQDTGDNFVFRVDTENQRTISSLTSTSTTAGTENALRVDITDTGVVTTGTDATVGLDINATRTGATGGTINTDGIQVSAIGDTGGTSTARGVYSVAYGADTSIGVFGVGTNITGSNVAEITGVFGQAGTYLSTATVTEANALKALVNPNSGASTTTTAAGLRVETATATGGAAITTNYGIIVEPQTVGGTDDYGIAIGEADTYTLWVDYASDSTTANAGITFGASGDTNLYRSAANTLATDDALLVGTLGTTDNASFVCRNTSNILAGCNYTPLNPTLTDNIADALDIQEGTNNYININTTDASENISFGNATTNPSFNFLGAGTVNINSDLTVDTNTLFVDASGDFVGVGTTTDLQGKLQVVGSANEPLLRLRANATQTLPLVVAEDSGGGELFRVVSPNNSSLFIGYQAASSASGGTDNTGFGYQTLFNNTGTRNTAFGSGALTGNTSGNNNIGIGVDALRQNQTGSDTVAIGRGAISNSSATDVDNGVFIGTFAGGQGVGNSGSGDNATIIGYQAGYFLDGGANNILLGYQAGDNLTTGGNNILIGYDLDASSATVSNELRIGGVLQGNTSTLAAQFNGTLAVTSLGTTDNASFVCRNTSNILAGCNYTPLNPTLTDNIADALDIQEGTNNYININTTDASENISFGNATTNPSFNFLGSGTVDVAGALNIQGTATFNSDVDLTLAETENFAVTNTITGTNAVNLLDIALTNNTTSGTQQLAVFTNVGGSTGTTEALIVATNADNQAVTDGILVTGGTGGITDGIDVSSSSITNAINVGSNIIFGGNASIDFNDFDVASGTGNVTTSGDIAVNGGDITTTQTTFNLINSTATTLNIGGAATTVEIGAATGTTSVNNSLTVDGDLTVATGQEFTNGGATLLTALAIANDTDGGVLGTDAASTVDVATTLNVNQTTASQTFTLATPTDTTGGRLIYVNNIGTADFTLEGENLGTAKSASYIWNGTAWIKTLEFSDNGVTTVGAIDSQTKSANGAVISGNTIYLQSADATNVGLVSTGVQEFDGVKTFDDAIVIQGNTLASYTSPLGTFSAGAALNLGNYSFGALNYDSAIYTGLTSSAASTARVVGIFDERATTNNTPPLVVFSPDESQWVGLGFDGQNSYGYVKGSLGIGIKSGANTLAEFGTNYTTLYRPTLIQSTTLTSYTTPQSSSVNTVFGIDGVTLGAGEKVATFAIDSGSNANSQAIAVLDNRAAGNNSPSIAVFTPNESNYFGLGTDGSNTTGYLKSDGTLDLGIKFGANVVTTFDATDGSALFQNSTDSTTAFNIQNQAGTDLFSVDTTNGGNIDLLNGLGEPGAWSTTTAESSARDNAVGGFVYNGYLYHPLGDNGAGSTNQNVAYAKINADGSISSGAWSTTGSGSGPARTNVPSIAYNGYIYAVGGSSDASTGGSNQDDAFYAKINADGTIGTWQTGTTIPANRMYGTLAVANGYLYHLGGATGAWNSEVSQDDVYYAKINADGSLGTWNTASNILPANRRGGSAVVANGRIYYIGGASASTASENDIYYAQPNPSTGDIDSAWTTEATNLLPADRRHGAAYLADGLIFYAGGSADGGSEQANIYYAQIESDGGIGTWSTQNTSNDLNTARQTIGFAQGSGYLYVMGGWDGGSALSSVEYTALPRVSINGSIDLVGFTSGNLAEPGGGGSITAGNGTFVGDLQVLGRGSFNQGLSVNGILNAGQASFQNSTDSTTGFQVLDADGGTPILNVDTTNERVGIGTNAPGTTLEVNGAAASGSYITTIQNTTDGGEILSLENHLGTDLFSFRTAGGGSGVFRIQNAGATDTLAYLWEASASYLDYELGFGIGTDAPSATLEVQTGDTENLTTLLVNQDDTTNNGIALDIQNAGTGNSLQINTNEFVVEAGGQVGIGTATPTADLQFGEGAARTLNVEARSTNVAGNDLTVAAGNAGAGASAFAGGVLNLQGGDAAGTGNANGGNVILSGGTGIGTGVNGLVVVESVAVNSVTNATCGVNCTITQANIDGYSQIIVEATASELEIVVPDPTIATAGRLVYITAADGTNDFTLTLNDGDVNTEVNIGLRENETATLIWNGSDWTAAGASSSTTLQSAYNNTLTSAGGAEIILNPTGGAADGLTIRNNETTPINGGILEIQSAIGTNLLSVNNIATEYVANGGAEDATSFTTDWTAVGSSTVSRETTIIATGTGSAQFDTTAAANDGIRNNLATNLATSTQYLVSFTARTDSGTWASADQEVLYSRDGGTDEEVCTNASTEDIVATGWRKFTCTITTDATAATNADLIIRQTDATARTVYIDNLSVTENSTSSAPDNVQIGGGQNGGPVTLFTLDRASAPPVNDGNQTYLGSMYYDTVTGRIQCYEADGWGACGSAPNNYVNLNPEYPGSVLNGTGIGTMTADFCAEEAIPTSVLNVNTSFCAEGEARNYYSWTSPQATQQTYSIYITYQLPAEFGGFDSNDTVTLTARTDNTTNGVVTYEMFRNEGGTIAACGTETTVTSTADTWQTVGINGNEATGCGFSSTSADDFVIFKINMKANSNASVYASTLSFTTVGQ